MAGPESQAHLVEAAAGGVLPPDDVPDGAAVALWCFLHRPALFREVFLHHEACETQVWHSGRSAARLVPGTLTGRAPALAAELRKLFRRAAGVGRFCAVEVIVSPGGVCFSARVADRLRLVEGFTDRGGSDLRCVRPALPVLFTYSPTDGSVRLRAPLRSRERAADLLRCFGRAVLRSPVECRGERFDLDRLKRPFRPSPDARDMVSARVKALHLHYPARCGRRHLKFETLPGDEPGAVGQMLAAHLGADADDLTVCHAELQVRLRSGGRVRDYPVRLWPDRCDLNHTPLGERLRRCLRLWGLARD